jgi:hypothetical protein
MRAVKNHFMFFVMPVMVAASCALMTLSNLAHAQSTPAPSTLPPQVLVTPLVGVVGEPRTISIVGQWPNTCPPIAATLEDELLVPAKTVLVRVLVLLTSVPCPSGVTPYRFELPYTGREVGVVKVVTYSLNGGPVNGRGSIITAPVATPATATTAAVPVAHSIADISGAWYEPATSGSGLSFNHAFAGSDSVFGTWFLYDSEGLPRWFSIQDVKWSRDANGNGTVMEGKLLETRAAANGCAPGINACPTSSASLATVGRVRATFVGFESGSVKPPQAKIEAFSVTDVLLFSSNIIRAF